MTENIKNNILQDFVGKKLFNNIIIYSANFDTTYAKYVGIIGLQKEDINWLILTFLDLDNNKMSIKQICILEHDTKITFEYFSSDEIICHSFNDFDLHKQTLLKDVAIYDVKTREFTNINGDKLWLN